jgi:hypothetical protein
MHTKCPETVMAGQKRAFTQMSPAIHVLPCRHEKKDVDARVKPGHDDLSFRRLA